MPEEFLMSLFEMGLREEPSLPNKVDAGIMGGWLELEDETIFICLAGGRWVQSNQESIEQITELFAASTLGRLYLLNEET